MDRSPSGRVLVLSKGGFGSIRLQSKIALFSAFVLALIGAFIYSWVPRAYEERALESARQSASAIAEITAFWAAPAIAFGDTDSLDQLIADIRTAADVDLIVIKNASGEPLAEFNPGGIGQDHALLQSEGVSTDDKRLMVSRQVTRSGELIGHLFLGTSLDAVYGDIRHTRDTIAIVSVVLLGTAAIALMLFTASVFRPLASITREFERIAEGDLSRRIETPGQRNEVSQLVDAFNVMVHNLEEAHRSLEETNVDLEDAVTERTKALVNAINEQRTTETALLASEQKVNAIVELASDVIFIKDLKGRYLLMNPAGERVLSPKRVTPGVTDVELFGEDIAAQILAVDSTAMESGVPLTYEEPIEVQGETRFFQTIKTPLIIDGTVIGIIGISRDITVMRLHEEAVKESLREKEALLREIHHRVKNNLQVIVSLLNLQSRNIGDGPAVEALKESRDRVFSMALLHELLYRSSNIADICLQDYLERLVKHQVRSSSPEDSVIEVAVDARDIVVGVEVALPLALIVNELFANALKHAFPHGRNGRIDISALMFDGQNCRVEVEDDGIGLPGDGALPTGNLGLTLVRDLAEQIGGSIEFDGSKGTRVTIVFSMGVDE